LEAVQAGSIRFLVNPGARHGAARAVVDRVRVLAGRLGVGLVVSRRVEDLANQARKAAEEGIERLLVVGGDGTMHHAVQGLAGTSTAIAAIPTGTGNDLARALGVPRGLEAAVRYALTAPVRQIDLILTGSSVCVGYAGMGFDSEVTRVANRIRRFRGPWIYPWAALRTVIGFAPPRARISWDGGGPAGSSYEGAIMLVDAANLPTYGGGMQIAPSAEIDDGLLDLVIVKAVSGLTFLRVFPKVYKGGHIGHPCFVTARARRVEMELSEEMELFGGGEPIRKVAAGEKVVLEVWAGGLAAVGPLP
jgi:diacylglycerol kinase (ATP)